jgi:hypothetical protein
MGARVAVGPARMGHSDPTVAEVRSYAAVTTPRQGRDEERGDSRDHGRRGWENRCASCSRLVPAVDRLPFRGEPQEGVGQPPGRLFVEAVPDCDQKPDGAGYWPITSWSGGSRERASGCLRGCGPRAGSSAAGSRGARHATVVADHHAPQLEWPPPLMRRGGTVVGQSDVARSSTAYARVRDDVLVRARNEAGSSGRRALMMRSAASAAWAKAALGSSGSSGSNSWGRGRA